jgi:predicted transcriptional regulator
VTETMTVKELAEVAGVDPSSVRRVVKRLGINIQNGVAARFDAAQSAAIISGLRIKGSRHIAPRQNEKLPRQNEKVQPEIMKAFSDALQTMSKMAEACTEANAMTRRALEMIEARPALPAPEATYATIAGYCKRHGIHADRETAARYGKIATALSAELGFQVRKISDERWGEVNAYHMKVLSQAVTA